MYTYHIHGDPRMATTDPRDAFVQHDLLYSQESLLKYKPGGYHPVNLHDLLSGGQYKVHRKLGWGGYSTVWLARDRKFHRWVAIKILTANASAIDREVLVLKMLARVKGSVNADGRVKWFNELLDSFVTVGPNGRHTCLVFEVLGPTIAAVVEILGSRAFELHPFRSSAIVRQLREAVESLHMAGFVHGDLNPHNIAFRWKSLAELRTQDIVKAFAQFETHRLVRYDRKDVSKHLPKAIIEAVRWRLPCYLSLYEICLLDFGATSVPGPKCITLDIP